MNRTLLLIDDDPAILESLQRFFVRKDWEVVLASTGQQGISVCGEHCFDLIVQDLELPGLSGLELLGALQERSPGTSVVVLTGHGDLRTAVRAIHAGADNFLAKPPDLEHLAAVAERGYEKSVLRRENRRLAAESGEYVGLETLESAGLAELAEEIASVADSDTTVLMKGETGTGKGWVARLLHSLSPRSEKPFVEVNCASLSAPLLESELFGHEKGAFTDAKSQKAGLFMAASGGTLFLDEIGDMEPALQPKLLKAIESGHVRRLGGTEEVPVDVRLVAATNRDLEAGIREGWFREDLYYRIAVYPLRLLPLRERGAGRVGKLAYELLGGLAQRLGRGPYRLSTEALEALTSYHWPGNIRELRNALERGLIAARGSEEIRPEHLLLDIGTRGNSEVGFAPGLPLEEMERRHILRALEHHDGNRSRTARALGIGRRTLYSKLRKYGF